MKHGKRIYRVALLILYIFLIFGATTWGRTQLFLAKVQMVPLRSYGQWFAGDVRMGMQILANILLFVPFGYLCAGMVPSCRRRRCIAAAVAAGFCLSLTVEVIQLAWKCGQFDMDDLLSNTFGAITGGYCMIAWENVLRQSKGNLLRRASTFFSVVFLATFAVLMLSQDFSTDVVDERAFTFSIEEKTGTGEGPPFLGYCFVYGEDADSRAYTLLLRELETGRRQILPVRSGIERQDVAAWYEDGYDYLRCGFEFTGDIPDGRYELMIQWGHLPAKKTGYYLLDGFLMRTPDEAITLPGVLLVSLPEAGVWVSQQGNQLFFVADDRFHFSFDGQTHIACHLWTRQLERLPLNRQEYGFDNLDFFFEQCEVAGTEGFRMAQIELPDEYAIMSIEIGGENGMSEKWHANFRPNPLISADRQKVVPDIHQD